MNKNSYFPYIVQTTKRWGIRDFFVSNNAKIHKNSKNA